VIDFCIPLLATSVIALLTMLLPPGGKTSYLVNMAFFVLINRNFDVFLEDFSMAQPGLTQPFTGRESS
jgi:hypothetical protein